MKTTIARCLVGLVLGASALTMAGAPQAQAVELGEGVEVGGVQALRQGIAYNPERDEYLAAYATAEDVLIVRLDAAGAILTGPTAIADDLGFFRFDTDVSYNASTNQYLVSFAQQIDPGDGQATLVSYGQLVSDTGALIGARTPLHAPLGTQELCRSMWPQHEANPATGGYTLLYTYVYGTTTDLGNICDGLAPDERRSVVASLGGDLSLGTSVAIAGGDPGEKDNHLAVNPATGDVLVIQRTTGPSGQATMFSPTLEQTASFSFVSDDRPNDNAIIDPVAASDPETGNWLIVWGVNGVTMVVDAAGNEVVEPANRVGVRLLEVDGAPDGSFWGVNRLGSLVHIGADGALLSSSVVGRDGGNPGLAIGVAEFGVRGLAFAPTGSFSVPVVVPFEESPTRPLAPLRILETRVGTPDGTADGLFEGIGVRRAGETLSLQVSGRGGVPTGADSVFLNIAAARASGTGFVTAFPCDEDMPTSSNLNFARGAAASSAAFVKLSADGTACLFTSVDVDLIVDVNGFVPSSASMASVVPARLLETRANTPNGTIDGRFAGEGRVVAGSTLELDVTGRGGVDDDAESVLINVTAVRPSTRLFVTVFPCGQSMPTAASLNAEANVNGTNLALAKIGDDGTVCLFSSGDTDLIVDVSAYVPAGGGIIAQTPERLVETRNTPDGTVDGREQGIGRLGADTERTFALAGRGSVPDNARGVVLNVAAINAETNGFITLHPCGERPAASNVNFAAGTVVSNGVFVALSAAGEVCVYSSAGTHVAIDVVGFTLAT